MSTVAFALPSGRVALCRDCGAYWVGPTDDACAECGIVHPHPVRCAELTPVARRWALPGMLLGAAAGAGFWYLFPNTLPPALAIFLPGLTGAVFGAKSATPGHRRPPLSFGGFVGGVLIATFAAALGGLKGVAIATVFGGALGCAIGYIAELPGSYRHARFVRSLRNRASTSLRAVEARLQSRFGEIQRREQRAKDIRVLRRAAEMPEEGSTPSSSDFFKERAGIEADLLAIDMRRWLNAFLPLAARFLARDGASFETLIELGKDLHSHLVAANRLNTRRATESDAAVTIAATCDRMQAMIAVVARLADAANVASYATEPATELDAPELNGAAATLPIEVDLDLWLQDHLESRADSASVERTH